MSSFCLALFAAVLAVPPQESEVSGVKPLTELGKGDYKGFAGGLYPDGKNERPAAHEKAGLALAKQVQPLDREGQPSANGRIVILSVGMSNTTQEYSAFMRLADTDKQKNPMVVLVDGAQGGMSADRIAMESRRRGSQYWMMVRQLLRRSGVTRAQVQVAWIKEADPRPKEGFPKHAQRLQSELRAIVRQMHERFPNLKLVYLSSRIYGGYARSSLNPEPYAYEGGFAVKWLIEQQLKGEAALNFDPDKAEVRAPWLSWGPYLWANGTSKRKDGVFYEPNDFEQDGTHPSPRGAHKVAKQLLHFFKTDSTTKSWFVTK
jgi:hypothetical protein